jgi:hypothetical protein
MEIMETETYRGLKIELVRDIDAESPREWENQWVFHCQALRTHDLGDSDSAPPVGVATTPIYAYEHGGIVLSLSPFSCPLDSGQIGVAWPKEASATLIDLESELATYNQYLSGDVWGFAVFNKDGVLVDSCYGFYGTESAIGEAHCWIDWYVAERRGSQVEITLV